MRRGRLLACLIVVLLASFQPLGYVSAQQQGAGPSAVYFPQSGHNLDNRYGFLDYWRTHGQVTRFGFPVTEVLEEDGRPVQYFERARMEYHEEIAEGDKVLLGLLGRERTNGHTFEKGAARKGRLFPETGYTVSGEFLQFWTKRGGLADFGYPLSESFVEKQPDGSERLVQWFERARLEYHIENVHPFFIERAKANGTSVLTLYEVLMGQIGREIAIQHEISVAPFPRRAGVPDWSPALWPQRIDVDLTKQRITAYEGDLQVFSAGVSTGKNGFETPPGTYYVYAKLLYDDMTCNAQGEEYDVRTVPIV